MLKKSFKTEERVLPVFVSIKATTLKNFCVICDFRVRNNKSWGYGSVPGLLSVVFPERWSSVERLKQLFFSEAMFLLFDVCNNDSYGIRGMA